MNDNYVKGLFLACGRDSRWLVGGSSFQSLSQYETGKLIASSTLFVWFLFENSEQNSSIHNNITKTSKIMKNLEYQQKEDYEAVTGA